MNRSTVLLATAAALLVAAAPAQADDTSATSTSGSSTTSTQAPATETPSTTTPGTTTPGTETSTTTETPTTTDVPTTTTTTTTTDTPTTTDTTTTVPDTTTPQTCTVDCIPESEDTGACTAATCVPATAGGLVPRTVGAGTALPFTGPGDVAAAILLALTVVLGGVVAWRWAQLREAVAEATSRVRPSPVAPKQRTGYAPALRRQEIEARARRVFEPRVA